jgi:hypothetical protein
MPSARMGEDGDGGVVDRRPFHRPASVAGHNLVEGQALLGSPHEKMAPQFRNWEHYSAFPDQKFVGRTVVHDSAGPCRRPVELEAARKQEPGISDLPFRMQFELFLAGVILRVGCIFVQESGTDTDREEFSFVLVPLDELASRLLNRDVDRDIDRDVDIHGGWGGGWYHDDNDWGWGSFAAGAAIGAVGAAVVDDDDTVVIMPSTGGYVAALPSNCEVTTGGGGPTLYECDGVYYQPTYQGATLMYQVVQP